MQQEQTSQEIDYSYKSLNGQFSVDESQGLVEAFVAGVGNKDSVGDICLPGCFTSSLKRRKPRVVWGHDWNSPIGKVLEIYEVGPNDPRLPAKMRKAGIGGLYVKVQFNMKSEKGKEAFANVSFFGLEQEWSIGYKTLDAVFDPVQTANLLKEVELYEVSPVLHGANQLTGTISVKADSIDTETKEQDGPCWPGYKQIGMKKGKNGNMVPNCVPIDAKSEEVDDTETKGDVPCWPGYKKVGMKKGKNGKMVNDCVPINGPVGKSALKDPDGGLTAAGRAHFKRTEGANLKPGVSGPADTPQKMRRKGSFLTRFFTNPSGPMKKPNGEPTRLALSAAAWGEAVPQNDADASKLAAKGRRLLERYQNSKKDDSESVDSKNHVAAIYSAMTAPQNETFGRASQLTRSLASHFGGPVRLVTADNDIAIFEMSAGQSTEMLRVSYHYDGDEFMFGTAQMVKPETVFVPVSGFEKVPASEGMATGNPSDSQNESSQCCPACAHHGNCDATVALTRNENPRIAFIKLKSLGDQLDFQVDPIEGGFMLRGFGLLTEQAQGYVVGKINDGLDVKRLNPLGNLAGRTIGIPNPRMRSGMDTNPMTARDADKDRLVLEGLSTINMGRGIPDPTPFGLNADLPGFGDPKIPDLPNRFNPAGSGRRGDLPRMMPRVPDPIEEPDRIPEPVEPVRVPVKPKVPTRPEIPVPEREPTRVPVPVEPDKVPVPVRPRVPVPEREPVPVGLSDDDFAIAAMGGGRRTPRQLSESLSGIDDYEKPSRQTRRARLRDTGIDEMRRLMLLGDESPSASMSDGTERARSVDMGRKIWLARTYDKISLEDAGDRFGITRQEARQLELRHMKALRDLGFDHPNRIGRRQLEDPGAGLTDSETDLLARRFDGETLDESADRLRTDRNAVRRMEQLALAKLRNRLDEDPGMPSSPEDFADPEMGREYFRNQAERQARVEDDRRRFADGSIDEGDVVDAEIVDESGDGPSAGMRRSPKDGKRPQIRPKARRAKRPASLKRNKLDPNFSQILESLGDSGPDGLRPAERARVAALIMLRQKIQNKIDRMRVRGTRRRMSELGPEIEELNRSIRGPFESLAEASSLITGSPEDLVQLAIKTANADRGALDLSDMLNYEVFQAVTEAGGDVATVAMNLGMDENVVRLRNNAHSMVMLISSRPAIMAIHRQLEKMEGLLSGSERIAIRQWLNGASDEQISTKINGSNGDVASVAVARALTLRKMGIDINAPEIRSKIVSGRIFYDEHGLHAEIVDDSGVTTYNRIGEGPAAGMAASVTTILDADFGTGRSEYGITNTFTSDANPRSEVLAVTLRPVKGMDEAIVRSLIGAELLEGDRRGSVSDIPAYLIRSGGEIVEIRDAEGKQIQFFGERRISLDEPLTSDSSREAATKRARQVSVLSSRYSDAVTKSDREIESATNRYVGLSRALEHLAVTGDWIGADLNVTGAYSGSDATLDGGLDADENGLQIVPVNRTAEQFELSASEFAYSKNPDATPDEIAEEVELSKAARISAIRRKIDLAEKELVRLEYVAKTRELRKRQNVVDLENLDDDVASRLGEETAFLGRLTGTQRNDLQLSGNRKGIVYALHKGPGQLDGGVLDPRRSAGVERRENSIAGQGDTRGVNRRYIDTFLQGSANKAEMVRQLNDFLARILRGESVVTAHPSIRRAIANHSNNLSRILGDGGLVNLQNSERPQLIIDDLKNLLARQEKDLVKFGTIEESLRKFGGENMDQMLSAEADPVFALQSSNFYGRYATRDIPDDVANFSPDVSLYPQAVDPDMLDRWEYLGGLRAGAFLVAGRENSEIVRGGLLGLSSEIQIISPVKPIFGISTPARVLASADADPSNPKFLAQRIGPALVARAIKMYERDGFVDVETVLTDPTLGPRGFVGGESEVNAGMTNSGMDIVARSEKFFKNTDGEYALPDRAMSRANQDELETLARIVETAAPMTKENELRLKSLVEKAEKSLLPKTKRKLPHDEDLEIGGLLENAPEIFVGRQDVQYDYSAKLYSTSGASVGSNIGSEPEFYFPVQIGLRDGVEGDSSLHPAAKTAYLMIPSRVRGQYRAPVKWNHPLNSTDNSFGGISNWESSEVGHPFNRLQSEIDFHSSRTALVDDLLQYSGKTPDQVIGNLTRRADKTRIRPVSRFNRFGYLDEPLRKYSQNLVNPSVTENSDLTQLRELAKRANAENKPLSLGVARGVRPGDKYVPSLDERAIYEPMIVSGEIDAVTREFVSDDLGNTHVVGKSESGKSVAYPINFVLMNSSDPELAGSEDKSTSGIFRNNAVDEDPFASMSRSTEKYVNTKSPSTNPDSGDDRITERGEVAVVNLPDESSVSSSRPYPESRAFIIASAAELTKELDEDFTMEAGDGAHVFTFSYPSTVPGKPRFKEVRNRSLINPLVVHGDFDPDTGQLSILIYRDGVGRLIPMSEVDLNSIGRSDWRSPEHLGNPDVATGALPTYVVGTEEVGGKKQQRVFNSKRMTSALVAKVDEATFAPPRDDDFATPEEESSTVRPLGVRSDPASEFLDELMPIRPDAFQQETAIPVQPDLSEIYPGRPTAWEVAKGLESNSPAAIRARQSDEKRWWDNFKKVMSSAAVWKKWKKVAVYDDEKNPLFDSRGVQVIKTPFLGAWQPWGNKIDENDREMPDGIKSELDAVKNFDELAEWVNGQKIAFVDFETTGIPLNSTDTGAPLQVSVYIVDKGNFDSPRQLTFFITPGDTPLEPWVLENVKFNGLSIPEALTRFPEKFKSLEDAKRLIADFVGDDAVIAGHNFRNFDMGLWKGIMGDFPIRGWMDTLAMANWVFAADNERFQEMKSMWNKTKDRDRDQNPFVNWFTQTVQIQKPGGRAWGSKKRRASELDRVGRRATGPLYFTAKLSLKNPERPQWWPDLYASQKLEALANYFGVNLQTAHDAGEDIAVTAAVLREMMKLGSRWGAAAEMFNPDSVSLTVNRHREQYASHMMQWRDSVGLGEYSPRETLFGDEEALRDPPNRGDASRGADSSGGSGRDKERGPRRRNGESGGGSGSEPPRNDSTDGFANPEEEPGTRVIFAKPNGVKVYENQGDIYFRVESFVPSRSLEEAVAFSVELAEARYSGYGFEFSYGVDASGRRARYKIYSMELLPNLGSSDKRTSDLTVDDYEIHGIDSSDGLLKRFNLGEVNIAGSSVPSSSDIELPIHIYPDGTGASENIGLRRSRPSTPHQYSDHSRRTNHNKQRVDEGPMAGMAGLTNRDGATNSTSYWTATENDLAMADLTDGELSERMRADRVALENSFNAGPARNAASSKILDSLASANRIMRLRTTEPRDHNGFKVSMTRQGYRLTGEFNPPPGVMTPEYSLPNSYSESRAEIAKNAELSVALNFSLATGTNQRAIERLSRNSRNSVGKLLGRLANHDYQTYVRALLRRRFENLSRGFAGLAGTPSSMGLLVDPVSELSVAARLVDRASSLIGLDDFGITVGDSASAKDYSKMELFDLLNDFNETVTDLFSYDHEGRYENLEFRIKSEALMARLKDSSGEIRRRYFESPEGISSADDPVASMSAQSPFGEADGIPILSGSKWLDARLHAIYGTLSYEKVASSFGERFLTLPRRDWANPSDDDLIDLYHYATMLNHDALVEGLLSRGEPVEDLIVSGGSFAPNGTSSVVKGISGFVDLPPGSVMNLIGRGGKAATLRRLAAMDPFSRAEEMNAIRRKKAFELLIANKKKELGDDFPLWLAEASIRNDRRTGGSTATDGRDDIFSGGPYIGFFGESHGEAMDNLGRYLGLSDQDNSGDANASMAPRRPFIRQRYDVKPTQGGFVIIDLDNRNAISSRVFSNKKEALRGAERMDRADRTFDPFAPPKTPEVAPSAPAVPPVVNTTEQPRAAQTFDGSEQLDLFGNYENENNASMAARMLPRSLRLDERRSRNDEVTAENASLAMEDYEIGRASLPYPSPDFVSTSRLVGGYASADSSLNTILGRLENLAGSASDDDVARNGRRSEVVSLISNLSKLQKRRNYFYNQLRNKLSGDDPVMTTVDGWHSERSGLTRESTADFGLTALPGYNLPSGLRAYGLSETETSPVFSKKRKNGDALGSLLHDAVSSVEEENSGSDEIEYLRRTSDQIAGNLRSEVLQMLKKRNNRADKFSQPTVRLGAQALLMAQRTSEAARLSNAIILNDLTAEIVAMGLVSTIALSGSRAGLAYLVNAVEMNLIGQNQAKRLLRDYAKPSTPGDGSSSRMEAILIQNQIASFINAINASRSQSKSTNISTSNKQLSMVTENLYSALIG